MKTARELAFFLWSIEQERDFAALDATAAIESDRREQRADVLRKMAVFAVHPRCADELRAMADCAEKGEL